jgi:hypothetical protein
MVVKGVTKGAADRVARKGKRPVGGEGVRR